MVCLSIPIHLIVICSATIFTHGHSVLKKKKKMFLGVIHLSCIYFTYLQFILHVAGGKKIPKIISNFSVDVNGEQ